MIKKMKGFVTSHKVISSLILIGIIIIAFFLLKGKKKTETHYTTTTVKAGNIVTNVSGVGQVGSLENVKIIPKVSGTLTYVGIKTGQQVKKGQLLFIIDPNDAQRAVRDAKIDLETAQLDLQNFTAAPTDIEVTSIKNAILDAQNSKIQAEQTVRDTYRTLLNSSTTPYSLNLNGSATPPTVTGVYLKDKATTITIRFYQTGQGLYFSASDPSGSISGSGLASASYPQPIGDSGLYIKFPSSINSSTSWLITLPNKQVSSYVKNEEAYQTALDNQKKVNRDADLSIDQKNQDLSDLYNPDASTLKSKQLVVNQKQNTLDDANLTLSKHYIYAPFAGQITAVNKEVGDLVSSSSIATLATNQKIATITLNEVDIAKVKVGEKVNLTFDAINELNLTGTVSEIDPVGTVSSGVVSYNVQITFDKDDPRVKLGMTVTASVITETAKNVLIVPNSAIKTDRNGSSYVLTLSVPLVGFRNIDGAPSAIPPKKTLIQVGISNDTMTEVTSGLKAGDIIVTKTTTATISKSSVSKKTPSILGAVSGGNHVPGAGAFRR